MKYHQLFSDLYWVGSLDPNLRVFDIIMHTEFGTTYNSYVLKGSEKTALIETSKLKCWESYRDTVESIVPFTEIDYIICDHTEPDHAGSYEHIIALNPKIQIVGTSGAMNFLKQIVNADFTNITVKDGDELSLGNYTLQFMPLPNLHWPDTMYTYVKELGVLFTCDSFGSHYSHAGIVRSTLDDVGGYARATKYYFDNILGPFKNPYLTQALERIKGLDIQMIATGHGPVLDSHLDEIFTWYRQWCQAPVKGLNKLVVIPYVSAYGYTKELAGIIAEGIRDSGDVDVELYDMVESSPTEVGARIALADGLLFGTPTILCEALTPIWNLLSSMFPTTHKGKLASAFGSYGWSGEGVLHVIERLKQINLNVLDGYRIRFKASASEKLDAHDFGYNFGCVLLNKEHKKVSSKSSALVKCIVCGEIFADTYEICPVCGVGKENFIPVEDTRSDFRVDTPEKYLILGGGAAAYQAAKAIRERNQTCSIVMISREAQLPYNRPMLTKSLIAEGSPNRYAIVDGDWYETERINIMLNTEVISIDPTNKMVVCGDMKLQYDKLIYALGAECFIPPIPGAKQDHVMNIRGMDDVLQLQKILNQVQTAVVIGGGVLGLEVAWQLHRAGIHTTVLEMADRLLPRQLDVQASAMLAEVMSNKAVDYHLAARITEITEQAVVLEDGTSYEADLVIISAGISPNVSIAKDAGLQAERFLVVNEYMETNSKDIYACGDCTALDGVSYALWEQAIQMGRVAGANAAGERVSYHTIDPALTFHGMDTGLYVLGDTGQNPSMRYKTVEIKDQARMTYEKLYFAKNRLVGVILFGDTSKTAYWTSRVKEHATYQQVMEVSK